MDVTVEAKGLKEFEARLQELDALAAQKLVRRVLRKVAKPLLERVKLNAAPFRFNRRGNGRTGVSGSTGAMQASMAIVTRREKGRQVGRVAVTAKANNRGAVALHNIGYGRQRRGIFYGWMVDKGHRQARGTGRLVRESKALTKAGFDRYERRRARGVGEKGRIKGARGWGQAQAHPWWTPAVTASEPQMVSDMTKEMAAALKRIERSKARQARPDSVVPE